MPNKHNINTSPHLSDQSVIGWNFDNSYAQLFNNILTKINPHPVKNPRLIILNESLSDELGLNFSRFSKDVIASIFAGNSFPQGSEYIAQAYAGHQFGYFTILGDGRAVLMGEHINKNNIRYDIQLKGSGKTPYSRQGDGRATLGPVLREYIVSEAMNSLNIPTTRSLAVVTTGENVIREKSLPGAILTRVASSHIRVGTFQYISMNESLDFGKSFIHYVINRHYPEVKSFKNQALGLLCSVIEKQIDLVINWMRVGFIHGVMNTDNVTISGETIDYGPCAFMNQYNPKTVFSSIDSLGRYSFGNQPSIIHWNLIRFAETLLPYISNKQDDAIKMAEEALNEFGKIFKKKWLDMMKNKLGIKNEVVGDEKLVSDFLVLLEQKRYDYTNVFCYLMNKSFLNNHYSDLLKDVEFSAWHARWLARINKNNLTKEDSLKIMQNTNPLVIPRNHNVEKVLSAGINGDLNPLKEMVKFIKTPYKNQTGLESYQTISTNNDRGYKTFCGT